MTVIVGDPSRRCLIVMPFQNLQALSEPLKQKGLPVDGIKFLHKMSGNARFCHVLRAFFVFSGPSHLLHSYSVFVFNSLSRRGREAHVSFLGETDGFRYFSVFCRRRVGCPRVLGATSRPPKDMSPRLGHGMLGDVRHFAYLRLRFSPHFFRLQLLYLPSHCIRRGSDFRLVWRQWVGVSV